jgi:hypothetical protein
MNDSRRRGGGAAKGCVPELLALVVSLIAIIYTVTH